MLCPIGSCRPVPTDQLLPLGTCRQALLRFYRWFSNTRRYQIVEQYAAHCVYASAGGQLCKDASRAWR